MTYDWESPLPLSTIFKVDFHFIERNTSITQHRETHATMMHSLQALKNPSQKTINGTDLVPIKSLYEITWEAEMVAEDTTHAKRAFHIVEWSIKEGDEKIIVSRMRHGGMKECKGVPSHLAPSPANMALHDVALVQHVAKGNAVRKEIKLATIGALSFPVLYKHSGEHKLL